MSQNDREALFAKLHTALNTDRAQTPEAAIAELNAQLPADIPRPEWSDERLNRFMQRLDAAAGLCTRIADESALVEAVTDAVKNGLDGKDPGLVGIAPHPLLQAQAWPSEWQISQDIATASAWTAAVTVAHTGIAETGTLVLPSGPSRPTTLNFLPDLHIVILAVADIVDYMEQAWERLRDEGALPRTVNMLTGPSRTADVEQTLQLGAHGPRRLQVILLG